MDERFDLAGYMRACAEQLEKHDIALWNAVCRALDEGNPAWGNKIDGKSYAEKAIAEIRRLYTIEKTMLRAIGNAPSAGER